MRKHAKPGGASILDRMKIYGERDDEGEPQRPSSARGLAQSSSGSPRVERGTQSSGDEGAQGTAPVTPRSAAAAAGALRGPGGAKKTPGRTMPAKSGTAMTSTPVGLKKKEGGITSSAGTPIPTSPGAKPKKGSLRGRRRSIGDASDEEAPAMLEKPVKTNGKGSITQRGKARRATALAKPELTRSNTAGTTLVSSPGAPVGPQSLRPLMHGAQSRREIELYFTLVTTALECLELTAEARAGVESILSDRIADARHPKNDLAQPDVNLLSDEKVAKLQAMIGETETYLSQQHTIRGVVTLQAAVRGFVQRRRYARLRKEYGRDGPMHRRAKAVRELVSREREYVNMLRVVVNEYHHDLEAAKVVSDKDLRQIFGNVRDILTLHEELCKQLSKLIQEKWPVVDGVADVFLTMAPYFRSYGEYFNSFSQGVMLLQSLQIKEKKVSSVLAEVYDRCEKKHVFVDLHGLLSAPLNHISGYESFLSSLDDSTPEDHPDAHATAHCAAIMAQTSLWCRRALANADNVGNLRRISQMVKDLTEPLTKVDDRSYVAEAECSVVGEKKKGKEVVEKAQVFLFSDMLLLAVQAKSGLKEKARFMLADLEPLLPKGADAAPAGSTLQIRARGGTLAHSVQFASDEDAARWAKLLQAGVDRLDANRVYGVALEKLVAAEKRPVPRVVEKLAGLAEPHLAVEGIFRLSGTAQTVDFIVEQWNRAGVGHEPEVNWSHMSPHDIATALKRFFDDLPEPLFTFSLYEDFLRVGKEHEAAIKSKAATPSAPALRAVSTLVNKLPSDNIAVMRFMFSYIAKIAARGAENKMSPQNLAICFAPSMFKPREVTINYSLQIGTTTALTEFMIRHSAEFLKSVKAK